MTREFKKYVDTRRVVGLTKKASSLVAREMHVHASYTPVQKSWDNLVIFLVLILIADRRVYIFYIIQYINVLTKSLLHKVYFIPIVFNHIARILIQN